MACTAGGRALPGHLPAAGHRAPHARRCGGRGRKPGALAARPHAAVGAAARVRLVATDTDWAYGDGPPAEAPIRSHLLTLTGRQPSTSGRQQPLDESVEPGCAPHSTRDYSQQDHRGRKPEPGEAREHRHGRSRTAGSLRRTALTTEARSVNATEPHRVIATRRLRHHSGRRWRSARPDRAADPAPTNLHPRRPLHQTSPGR